MKAALEAEVARLEAELAEARARLERWVANIPDELHDLTVEAYERVRSFFMSAPPAPPAAP